MNAAGEDVTANYEIIYRNGSLEVTPRLLTITAESAERIYDGTALAMNSVQADDLADRWDRYAARNGVVPVDFAGVNAVASAAAAGWYAMDWVTEPSVATGAPGE